MGLASCPLSQLIRALATHKPLRDTAGPSPYHHTAMQKRQRAARASGAVLSSSGGLTFDRSVMQDDPLDVNLAPCRYGSSGM